MSLFGCRNKIAALLAAGLLVALTFLGCSSRQEDPPAAQEPQTPAESVLAPVQPGTEVVERDGVSLDLSSRAYGSVLVSCRGQQDLRYKIRVLCGEQELYYDLRGTGESVRVPLQFGDGTYEVRVYEQVTGDSYSPLFAETFDVALRSEFEPFLYPSVIVPYDDDSDCVALSRQLCVQHREADGQMNLLYRYVADTISYDQNLADRITGGQMSGYLPNPDETLKTKTGICYDYSALLAAMLRTQRVPTRLVMGYLDDGLYHAWNEVYIGGRWVLADATMDGQGYRDEDYYPTRFY